jgi:glycosyltransferase involved in cell wall biosynthesis
VAYTLEQCWHRVPGGTAQAALEVAAELAGRRDLELIGVAARHSEPPPEAFRPQIEVRHLPLPRTVLYEAWHYGAWPPVQRATGPVDVIHVTGMAMPPKSAPLLVTVHDLAFVHDPSRVTRHGRRFFDRALALAIRRADVVLCSSEATARDCRHAGFDRDRLRVVPLGVRACPASPPQIADARARYGLARPYVLWTGTAEPRKNLPVVVEAFRKLDRSDLDLVLVGPTGWHTDVEELVRPLSDQVRVLGFLPRHDLESVLAGADVFCFPSLLEGFGLPVVEAMAQGTPVVTSAGTSTEEVAGGAALLVDPYSAAEVADALASVLEDTALAERLSAGGQLRAREMSWTRTAHLTMDAYRELAA